MNWPKGSVEVGRRCGSLNSEQGALERSVEWLDNVYVQGRYQGKIVTDFDEHRSRFQQAPLSLDRVMTNRILREDVLSQLGSLPNFYGHIQVHLDVYQTQITNSTGFDIGPQGRVSYRDAGSVTTTHQQHGPEECSRSEASLAVCRRRPWSKR